MIMLKEEIIRLTENYMEGKTSEFKINTAVERSELEDFYLRTAERLINSYNLQKEDAKYLNDFLIAFRDFLLVFETVMPAGSVYIPNNNDYAIKQDESTGKYYAAFDFPDDVPNQLATQAFMRDLPRERNREDQSNLMTDSYIYSLTSYKRFKSLAQKLAVYGALNTPAGYTTLISLPTGGGKSLITQMMAYQSEGLTIVVMPTVSLADDQLLGAKRVIKRETVEQEIFTYKSGVSVHPILNSIKNKTARLLFISPEALMKNQAFEEVVAKANDQHYIKNIVIDEAHIVVDWGASFRVDYQCLQTWRKKLLLKNPSIRTILLSATFEEKSVDILKKLFSESGRWIEVRCDALRHEPRFILLKEKNYYQKNNKTLDLVKKLPHPMIIYVARPDDAENVKKLLEQNGINNVFTYTGLTKRDERENLLKAWKLNKFEIMVATSAFGVGVDKPDVRTVMHLYIPENPNSYYQELGRGGRDKLPCLSVMCIYPDDINTTFQRINKRVMTTEKIIRRWDSMYNNKSSRRDGNLIYIDTSIKPNYHSTDEWEDTPTSDVDMKWNIYVLLLFRRYGLIKIIDIVNDKGVYQFVITIMNNLLLNMGDEQTKLINDIRDQEWDYYNDAFLTMKKAVRESENQCWSEMFFKTYDLVDEYCAGCNAHTEINNGDAHTYPLKKRINEPVRELLPDQIGIFENQNEIVIMTGNAERAKVIGFLLQKRVSCLIASTQQLNEMHYFETITSPYAVFIVGETDARELLKKENYYYISGIVAVLYPDQEENALKTYNLVSNYLRGKAGIHIIHILSSNFYIPSVDKKITDFIDGRVIEAKAIFE